MLFIKALHADTYASRTFQIGQDPSVRCVIVGAAGKVFCSGHDLKEIDAAGQGMEW